MRVRDAVDSAVHEVRRAHAPAIVLGGTGYVAGELLRLLAGHPSLGLAAVASAGHAGEPIASAFPHLAYAYRDVDFVPGDALVEVLDELAPGPVAVFSAVPHGESAAAVDWLLTEAEARSTAVRVVDLSADFRHRDPVTYAAIYGRAHGAPDRLGAFVCALPELTSGAPASHVAHPGCFATAIALASVPLLGLGLVEPRLFVSAVTGSTGSGRQPGAGTHHPERHANLYAYKPLAHRHAPEVADLAEAAVGVRPEVAFVPHSGPFARGIHATVQARASGDAASGGTDAVASALAAFYADSPFVSVVDGPPRLKDVVGTNRCHLGVAGDGRTVAVMAAIDNLVKGAAGGAVQWMNRMLELDESAGLESPALGWS